MCQHVTFWYLSPLQVAKAQTSLHIRAVIPEHLLLTQYDHSQKLRQQCL